MTAEEFRKLCDAVEGYTTLELFEEAQKLLGELPSKFKITKEVIRLHMTLLAKRKEYRKASFLAETLSLFEPDDVENLLMVARLRYMSGEIREALEWLITVETKCSGDDHFNYLCAINFLHEICFLFLFLFNHGFLICAKTEVRYEISRFDFSELPNVFLKGKNGVSKT